MWATLLSPIHSPEKAKVLQAIEGLGSKIVPADVATRTGLPLLKVTSELNQIATETGGHLEVGSAGTIVYQFDPLFQSSYLLNGSRHFFRQAGRLAFNVGAFLLRAFCLVMFFLIRVTFGLLLILSVVAVIALVVIAIMRAFGDNDSGGDGGNSFDLSGLFDFSGDRPFYLYWAFDWLWDWWFWGGVLFPTRYTPVSQSANYDLTDIMSDVYRRREHPDRNYEPLGTTVKKTDFLTNCFSFLFGDGDPNAHFEEERWQTLAEVIRSNQGTVTCEQLAPYTGKDPNNEDWVLPILVRFNGSPEVTESGQIIYVFPSFQPHLIGSAPLAQSSSSDNPDELRALYRNHLAHQPASADPANRSIMRLDKYLPEKTWEFMPIPEESVMWICVWAGVVLCLSTWLLFHLALIHPFGILVFPLFAYGCFFVVVPAVRWLIVEQINKRITARNDKKLEYSAMLANPSRDLAAKLESARQIRATGVPTHAENVVYTTDKDALEQEFGET